MASRRVLIVKAPLNAWRIHLDAVEHLHGEKEGLKKATPDKSISGSPY